MKPKIIWLAIIILAVILVVGGIIVYRNYDYLGKAPAGMEAPAAGIIDVGDNPFEAQTNPYADVKFNPFD